MAIVKPKTASRQEAGEALGYALDFYNRGTTEIGPLETAVAGQLRRAHAEWPAAKAQGLGRYAAAYVISTKEQAREAAEEAERFQNPAAAIAGAIGESIGGAFAGVGAWLEERAVLALAYVALTGLALALIVAGLRTAGVPRPSLPRRPAEEPDEIPF